jgi:alpha-glucosidase
MIKSIPAVWDETIVLPDSEIGELAAFARRSRDTWFLAVLNGPHARKVQITLSFLGSGKYRALLVRDRQEEAAAVDIEDRIARRGDALAIEMSNGGGFLARFSKR